MALLVTTLSKMHSPLALPFPQSSTCFLDLLNTYFSLSDPPYLSRYPLRAGTMSHLPRTSPGIEEKEYLGIQEGRVSGWWSEGLSLVAPGPHGLV